MAYQSGIIDEIPNLARYQFFRLKADINPAECLRELADIAIENDIVIGLGQALITKLNADIPHMRKMPKFTMSDDILANGQDIDIPTTPHDLWCWIRGEDRGDLVLKARLVRSTLAKSFDLDRVTDGFKYNKSRDLSGYEDGTENPIGQDALDTAILESSQKNLNGSSYVAVQQWIHDLDTFLAMSLQQQNHIIGRDQRSNEELDDAPESAHVKRTAQEDFEPEAFVVRRSMPWANETEEGLVFVAFDNSFDSFEALMNRMIGNDDGIVDDLFSFTRPITGSYFWCPPVTAGKIDLSAVLNS